MTIWTTSAVINSALKDEVMTEGLAHLDENTETPVQGHRVVGTEIDVPGVMEAMAEAIVAEIAILHHEGTPICLHQIKEWGEAIGKKNSSNPKSLQNNNKLSRFFREDRYDRGYDDRYERGGPPQRNYGGRSGGGGAGGRSGGTEDADGVQPVMMTFKAFLGTQDDSISDEDAVKKYAEYKLEFKRQQLNEFFVTHKDEEW